jgi:hypothetical protein
MIITFCLKSGLSREKSGSSKPPSEGDAKSFKTYPLRPLNKSELPVSSLNSSVQNENKTKINFKTEQ